MKARTRLIACQSLQSLACVSRGGHHPWHSITAATVEGFKGKHFVVPHIAGQRRCNIYQIIFHILKITTTNGKKGK
jgi:hypothetical protein